MRLNSAPSEMPNERALPFEKLQDLRGSFLDRQLCAAGDLTFSVDNPVDPDPAP